MIDVEIILNNSDVALVLNQLGIEWERKQSKRGYELYFACPTTNHSDDPRKKRCSVADSGKYKGHFNCWACDFHGNLIHLIRYMLNVGFKEALQFLESRFGSSSITGGKALEFRLRMNKPDPEEKQDLIEFDLPDGYVSLNNSSTIISKDAKRWLRDDRLIDDDCIDRFEIGIIHRSNHGPMIIIPVRFRGKVHSIFSTQPMNGGLKRYPKNSPQGKILFNYDACINHGSYVMVESILDAIKIWSVCRINSMACFTNMISSDQLNLLRGFNKHGVMPDLDGDRGWDLVNRMVPIIGKSLWIYTVPVGKDPGDCSAEELQSTIDQGIRYCDYECNQLFSDKTNQKTKVQHIKK